MKPNGDSDSFCEEFLLRAKKYASSSCTKNIIMFGSKNISLYINTETYHGELINGAFLSSESKTAQYEIYVWDSSFPEALPNVAWAEQHEISNIPIPYEKTEPYRILFDRGNGMIFVFDCEKKIGAVWMRDHSQIDIRCCVSPFRVLFSWIANDFDAEIIHASGVEIDGEGILISGSSGSGKSTLAIYSALSNHKILSDDAILIEGTKSFAFYSRAKISAENNFVNFENLDTFELNGAKDGKRILPLPQLENKFIKRMSQTSIVFPVIVDMSHIQEIPRQVGYKYFIDQSMRELFGGDRNNLIRHVKLLDSIPNYRMALSGNVTEDLKCLTSIITKKDA